MDGDGIMCPEDGQDTACDFSRSNDRFVHTLLKGAARGFVTGPELCYTKKKEKKL